MKKKQPEKRLYFYPERCMMCLSCVLACQLAPLTEIRNVPPADSQRKDAKVHMNLRGGTPWLWRCRQCLSAPCEEACFTGGLKKSAAGVVEQDRDRCVSCGSCYLSCPLDGMHMGTGDRPPIKCDLCKSEHEPLCVRACPGKALEFTSSCKSSRRKQHRYVKKMKCRR